MTNLSKNGRLNDMKRLFPVGMGVCLLFFMASGCATRSVSRTPPRTIAVFDLADYSTSGDALSDMGEILTARLIQVLQETPSVTVVEREKLALALEELHLGSSMITDKETQLRIGQMLGARQMVFGGFQVFSGTMRLDIRLVDVETGKIIRAIDQSGPAADISGWLKRVDEMGNALLE